MLSEVVLKLTGWRQRSYPIVIHVDGREAYRGTTERTLGYVTLPLSAEFRGRAVRIGLFDASTNRDAFNITELENPQNAATGADRIGTGTLGIVEVEFYEAAAPAVP
jgi:hypothetical protein